MGNVHPFSLNGKTVLITGAAGGIGRAAAIALAEAGAKLVVTDIAPLEPTLEALEAAGLEDRVAIALPCDITDANQVNQMVMTAVQQLGEIDVLFNNAGILRETPLLETDIALFDKTIAVNVRGTFLVGQAVIHHMMEEEGGRIINTASELAYLGRENYSVYCASKGAVISLTRSWAREFAPKVLVNAIAPGPIDTPMLDFDNLSVDMREKETSMPLQRIGTPEEVAAAVVFLASPGASYITGHTLSVNGGAVMV